MNKLTRSALVGALFLGVAACADSTPTEVEPNLSRSAADRGPTIVDIAVAPATDESDPEFTILVQALQAANLVDALDGNNQLTVFAPTDAAFGRLLDLLGVTAEELLADTDLLTDVLLHHVARGRRTAEDVLGSDQIRTLNGGFVFPTTNAGSAYVVDGSVATDDAEIVATDIAASNGVIHVIDEVLVPGDGSAPGDSDASGPLM